ncbi:putative isomerase [Halobacteriovorax marinus SJ]|uniref:2-hydroxychromene-2-carboxylate isomerase n=1 Tax=Halobacteriovorax marinus (strain ATCC BAA-682 / DSM 15412 / SJ) TaxID=862908 RepID=E1X506_HALMS|nr:2-hydroxychromene-2-carboxylate isomerase [Halobacteriovorax marinus]CBW27232.1 putative isomerase [Halobacteriovorax marinus SJ]
MDFYFDFLSPYSYLAFQWLKKNKSLLESLNIEVNYLPTILSKLIHSYETKGPAEIKSKREYLFKDCVRYSVLNDIPFNTPKTLPFNSLYALRLVLASEPSKRFDLIDAIFTKGWGRGGEIGTEESLIELLQELGIDESLMEKTTSKEIRIELKGVLKEAISKGVFGLPTFIYKEELFWGNDSTKYLELFIANKDPLDQNKYNNFLKNHPFN